MKNKFSIKNIISSLLILGLTLGFSSCEDVNDWGVDDSFNRMFSPVTFETAQVGATSVSLRFSSVPNAQSYVIEFSKDSLQFTTITNTVEILADDIVLSFLSVIQNAALQGPRLEPSLHPDNHLPQS